MIAVDIHVISKTLQVLLRLKKVADLVVGLHQGRSAQAERDTQENFGEE